MGKTKYQHLKKKKEIQKKDSTQQKMKKFKTCIR